MCNGAKGSAGSENAFNFNNIEAVVAGEHRIHTEGAGYWGFDTSTVDFDISFQMEFGDWGDDGWFGFNTAGHNQLRIYNHKIETKALVGTDYEGRHQEQAFSEEITSGWHTVRMIMDDGNAGATGGHTTFTVKVIIDGVETGYSWFAEDWSGNAYCLKNNTDTTVNVTSTNTYLLPSQDISDLAISNNTIGNVGGNTAFNFNEVQSVATGEHRIHTDKNYGQWNTSVYDIDVSFQVEFADWGNGYIAFRLSSDNEIRLYNDKVETVRLVGTEYEGQHTSKAFAEKITSGWHTVRLYYCDGKAGCAGGDSNFTVKAYIDGVEYSYVHGAMADWGSSGAFRLMNQTGTTVKMLSTKVEAPSAQKAINALVNNAYMTAGASIRLNANGNGIRFETNVLAKDVEELKAWMANGAIKAVSFGTMIVPTDYLTEGETLETLRVAGKVADCVSTGFYEKVSDETTYRFWGSLVDIQAFNYTRSFIGVGYICVTDSEDNATYYYVEYDLSNARSMYSVAKAAYTSDYAWTEAEKTALKAYIDGVVIINTDGQYMGGLDEAVYTPAYSVSYADGVVTITSTSEIKTVVVYMSETQIVRLTSAQLTFSNENKTVSFEYNA